MDKFDTHLVLLTMCNTVLPSLMHPYLELYSLAQFNAPLQSVILSSLI